MVCELLKGEHNRGFDAEKRAATGQFGEAAGREEFTMSKQLGPIEIDCDAPPYAVVYACNWLGFESPEDVRWCRLDHVQGPPHGWRETLFLGVLRTILGVKPPEKRCCCGEPLPALRRFCLTFNTGLDAYYLLGQCPHCHTVFWDEV